MVEDIDAWLRALGLERYAAIFEENEVDLAALPHLTEEDLKEIGVKLGARRQMLAAINELGANVPAEAETEAGATVTDADRRQLTVLFIDLVGSTALSGRLDPEDMRTTLQRYTDVVSDKVRSHGGYVANYLGDGVLAYFGWPAASEDQAEQAARTALASLSAVAGLTSPLGDKLAARAGIATGAVVVGDIDSDAGRQTGAVSGETPNLAARLQGEATPGDVIIGPTTQALISGRFELAPLGARQLKGIAGPVETYRVVREIVNESRFAARAGAKLTPLVGREAELALLLERWRAAQAGEGQVVLLSGEAGIGKSRTTQELVQKVAEGPHIRLRYQCAPHQTNTPFFPILGQLERAARFEAEDDPSSKLNKLEATLAENVADIGEAAPLLAALLSLPTERYPSLDLTPQARRQKIYAALADQVDGIAGRGPVLIVVEDAHWIDPTSLEAFSEVVNRIEAARVMLLVTSRPEFTAPWPVGGHVSSVALARLTQNQGRELAQRVTGGKAMPEAMIEQIMTRADGNPLFVEELTKTVVESGALRDAGDHFEMQGELQAVAVPNTLQSSLMARLDGLSSLKQVAQIAACIGRDFSHELLAAAVGMSDQALTNALDQLTEAELIFRRGASTNAVYTFKHALIQDSARDSLLRSRREELHRRIAEALLQLEPDLEARRPEILAYHWAEAGDATRAVELWLKAGQAAISTASNREAIGFMNSARVALEATPASPHRNSLELDTQILTAAAYIGSEGYASKGTEEAYLRGRELLDGLPVDHRHSAVIYGLFVVTNNHANHIRSLTFAEELRALAETQNDPEMLCVAHRSLAVAYNPMGRFRQALDHSVKAVSFHDPSRHAGSAFRYGHDIGVAALWHLALSRLCLGLTEAGDAARRQALAMSAEVRHPTTTAYAGLWNSFFQLMQRNADGALAAAEDLYDFAGKRGMAVFEAQGRWMLAASRVIAGQDYAGAIAELDAAADDMDGVRCTLLRPSILSFRAEACLALGDKEDAAATARLGLKLCEETEERWYQPELHRHFAAALTDCDEATAELNKAAAVAAAQEAKLMEMRAAIDIARSMENQANARASLHAAVDRLALDSATPDAAAARVALQQL